MYDKECDFSHVFFWVFKFLGLSVFVSRFAELIGNHVDLAWGEDSGGGAVVGLRQFGEQGWRCHYPFLEACAGGTWSDVWKVENGEFFDAECPVQVCVGGLVSVHGSVCFGYPVKIVIFKRFCTRWAVLWDLNRFSHPHGYDLWNTLEGTGEGAYMRRVYAPRGTQRGTSTLPSAWV